MVGWDGYEGLLCLSQLLGHGGMLHSSSYELSRDISI